jgi:crotonobetainyl-CoA:carnitine CoA-transferase CaiB-like acyl-CoA transferase
MAAEALQHLKVLEISDSLEVAYGGKLLADFGAEVIKIETPERGDPARYIGPYRDDQPDPEASGAFLMANTNKKGITLDITTETGKEIFKSLVKETDILLEGYPPGTMENLRLGYDDLKTINPRLIMTSVSPYGQTGPYRDYKAYPLNLSLAGIQGYILPVYPKDETLSPVRSAGRTVEIGCAWDVVTAVLGALFRQAISGEGFHIDVSIQETISMMHIMDMNLAINFGMCQSRWVENRAFSSPIKCKDGYFMLYQYAEFHDWKYIKEMLKFPELDQEKFNIPGGTGANWPELEEIVEKWSVNYTKEELLEMCQKYRVAGAPASNVKDLFENKQFIYRGYFVNLPHKVAGTLPYPSAPAKYDETPVRFKTAAPLLGEHNEEILAGRLGYNKDKIKKLRDTKII